MAQPCFGLHPQRLLKEAAKDPAGIVQFAHYGTGDELVTNDRNLLPDDNRADARATAAWEAALKELVDGGLLAARGTAEEIFEVTKKRLRRGQPPA